MRHTSTPFVIAAGVMLLTLACGGGRAPAPSMTAPTPPPAVPPPAPSAALAGSWLGRATDSQGDTDVSWSLMQTGNTVTGTVTTQAVNRDDGSCNSCHRNKSGSVSGVMSGATLTLTMFFAAGVDGDPTPACSATVTGTATVADERTLRGVYSGADTCEGAFANGSLAMARQP